MTDERTESRPQGRHFASPAPAEPRAPRPDETAIFLAAAQHHAVPRAHAAGEPAHFGARLAPAVDDGDDAPVASAPQEASASSATAPAASTSAPAATEADDDFGGSGDYESVGRSAGLMTLLIIISRITGFARTWFMGIAFGVTLLASSYNIANNLPNMLYELVMGGMLITAFLPIYMDARRQGGREGANDYVGNLLSLLLVFLGAVSVIACAASPFLIWTQSFMGGSSEMDLAVYFFRFFAFQILFYGLGSVFSGVLNAHRDYFWSNVGPILNNVVVIAAFAAYPWLSSVNGQLAVTVLAVGTTLGVVVQMACQIPALKKYGIRPRMHINLRDPLLRRTLGLGIPTLVATGCSLVTTSVINATAFSVQPDVGASVIAYARLWYTLPYSLLAVSLNTALYTELARDATNGDDAAVRAGISRGVAQQLFVLIPFAFYLIVFSFPLNMIYCAGDFDVAGVELVSEYLAFLAPSLPLYGVCVLMQKACSALRDMRPYAIFILAGAVAEIVWAMVFAVGLGGGMPQIALSMTASYLVSDVGALIWIRRRLKGVGLRSILHGAFWGLVLGAAGAAAGGAILYALETFVAPLVTYLPDGTTITASAIQTLGYIVVAGVASLIVTFAPAIALKLPEAGIFTSIVRRAKR